MIYVASLIVVFLLLLSSLTAAQGRVLGMLRVVVQRHLAGQAVCHLLVPLVQRNVQRRTRRLLLCSLLRLQLQEKGN